MRPPSRRFPPFVSNRGRHALTVVLLYACFSALWILLSDQAVDWLLADDLQHRLMAHTLKGWLFVAVTSMLLYFALLQPLSSQPDGEVHDGVSTGTPRQRLVPWLAILALGGTIVALSWVSIAERYEERRTAAGHQLHAIGAAKAEQIAAWHQERWNNALAVQNSVELAQQWLMWAREGLPQTRQALQERLRRIALAGQFNRVELIDAEGRGINDPQHPERSSDPALLDAVRATLATGTVQRFGPHLDHQGRPRLYFLAPVALGYERPVVAVLHYDPPATFHPALATWPLPQETGEAVLFRQEGDRIEYLSDLKRLPNAALRFTLSVNESQLPAARVMRGDAAPATLVDGLDYAGFPVYAVVLPVGDTGWWLLVKQDRSELMFDAVQGGLNIAL